MTSVRTLASKFSWIMIAAVCSLGVEGDQSVTDAAGLDTGFHFQGDVNQFFPNTGGDGNGVFHDFLERI